MTTKGSNSGGLKAVPWDIPFHTHKYRAIGEV